MQITMDHIVLNVQDETSMLDFYTRVLGMETDRLEEDRAGDVSFPSVRLNEGTIIDLFPPKMHKKDPASVPNLNHFCMVVDKADWEATRSRLEQEGIEIDGPSQVWGARGEGESIYFADPDGNRLELKHYAG
jgi:catechol 2,3-dioxygenase-like lactoylglutathione lyase family enzyme